MFKRVASIFLGIALIGLGVFFFVSPERSYALHLLTRYWPVFLIMAGLVRVVGHLIDRQPRSPVGGLIICAVGGVLLSANLRGEHSFVRIFGNYWFWILLAYIIGRVIRQYTHRDVNGRPTSAFSPGAVALMLIIAGGGLTANYIGKNTGLLNNLGTRIDRISGVRDYLFGDQIAVEDEKPQLLDLKPGSKLIIDGSTGDIEITASQDSRPNVRIIKRIRTTSEELAAQLARSIHLKVSQGGNNYHLSVEASDIENDFSTSIIVSIPKGLQSNLDIVNALGATKLTGIQGEHTINNCEQIQVTDNSGGISIMNPRGAVELSEVTGNIRMVNLRRNSELRRITGELSLDIRGGSTVLNQITGPIKARVHDARLEIINTGSDATGEPLEIARIEDIRNSRLQLRDLTGNIVVNAQNTRIDADSIKGNFRIDSTSGRTIINKLDGSAQIRAQNGPVEITGVTGAVFAESVRDITVRNFRSTLDLSSKLGTINLSTDEKLVSEVKAVSEKGRIRISLPRDAGFRFDASSSFGRVRINGFDQMTLPIRERSTVSGYNINDTGPLVSLRSASGDIRLQSSGPALVNSVVE